MARQILTRAYCRRIYERKWFFVVDDLVALFYADPRAAGLGGSLLPSLADPLNGRDGVLPKFWTSNVPRVIFERVSGDLNVLTTNAITIFLFTLESRRLNEGVTDARNELVDTILAVADTDGAPFTPSEYLALWIDDDAWFAPGTVRALCDWLGAESFGRPCLWLFLRQRRAISPDRLDVVDDEILVRKPGAKRKRRTVRSDRELRVSLRAASRITTAPRRPKAVLDSERVVREQRRPGVL
jgi:hypothetical protein